MSLQAFLFNRVWVVIDNSNHEQVGGPFPTKVEAERFMLELWRDQKPETAESVSWDADDPTDTLLAILDKPAAERMGFRAAA